MYIFHHRQQEQLKKNYCYFLYALIMIIRLFILLMNIGLLLFIFYNKKLSERKQYTSHQPIIWQHLIQIQTTNMADF